MNARGFFAIAGIRLAFAVLLIASCSGQAGAQVPSSTFGSPVVVGTSRQTATIGTSLDLGSNTDSILLPVGTTGQEPTCNASLKGGYRYNSTVSVPEFCNGSAWSQLVPVSVTPTETAPSGHGYFVLTGTSYNGNLGGLNGADADCLTELTVTNTSWQGYSTANSNGQLIASKVHAFLCTAVAYCNNLMPLTTYYFANAGNPSAGGASFTTDSNGLGPNDNNNWSGANYFGGTYSYWGNRGSNGLSTTAFSNANASGVEACSATWVSAANSQTGWFGASANTTNLRWNTSITDTCDATLNLICFVNP
jgi:hypothetical protein